MIKKSPTAINKRGTKVDADNYKFDSQKEYVFYERFVKNCGFDFEVHPRFVLQELTPIEGGKITAIRYTPDFIIYDDNHDFLHVYDVKNSFGAYGIDQGNKLRFRLFAAKYGIPVEAVVVLKNQFKSIAQGVSKPLKDKDPIYRSNFNYDWREATNYNEPEE